MTASIAFTAGILFGNYVRNNPQHAKALGVKPLELGALLLVLHDAGSALSTDNVARLWETVGNHEDAHLTSKYEAYYDALTAQSSPQHQVALSNGGSGAEGSASRPKESPYVTRLRKHRERKVHERDMRKEIQGMSKEAAQKELALVNGKIQGYINRGRPNARAMVDLDTRKYFLEDKLGLN